MNDTTSIPSTTEAARRAHDWVVQELYPNVLEHAGRYDSKIEVSENTSLAAHILNAVTVSVNSFIYEAYDPSDDFGEYREDIEILAAATALHDTDKYLREAHGIEVEGNTEEALAHYFGDTDRLESDGDDFGIEEFLGSGHRADLLYLIQRCEIGEDTLETRGIDTDVRGLERYVRLGDQVASIAQRDGVRGVYQRLEETLGDENVHLETFEALEQPILNELFIGSVKEVVSGEAELESRGVVIGSTSEAVVYLGDSIDRQALYSQLEHLIPDRVSNEFDFTCKLNWNSFDYDILAEIGLPVETKEEIIAEEFRELLKDGTAGVEPFEYVPEEFDAYVPVLAKMIYLDKRSSFDDPELQADYDRIKEETNAHSVKIHFIAHLARNLEEYRDVLDDLVDEIRPKLHEDLAPESDAIGTSIDRFFGRGGRRDIGSKEQMCFLCGSPASSTYQKGTKAIYRTYEYSRRLPPHEEYKSICEICNLEYALFEDTCVQSDVSPANDLEAAYFYFDDFIGDVRVKSGRTGSLVQGETIDLGDPDVTRSLIKPQYVIQPVYMLDDNHRMKVVREIMKMARRSGMKVVLGRPFTRFESEDVVFRDENAARQQELLGLDEVERFGPTPSFVPQTNHSHLRRAEELFKLMNMIGRDGGMSNPYIQLDRDEFHTLVHFALLNHDRATILSELRSYLETYHGGDLMEMKQVARTGTELFGTTQFDSKYKKTKVFREALDALLTGMSQGMEGDELSEYAEGQIYALADREQYAGHVQPSEAETFIEEVFAYLEDNDLTSLKKLSDWENALVNSYYYACEHNFEEETHGDD